MLFWSVWMENQWDVHYEHERRCLAGLNRRQLGTPENSYAGVASASIVR